MKIFDICAGKGFGVRYDKIVSLGHTYEGMDINPEFNCTYTGNLFDWKELPEADFYWFSPYCTYMTVLQIGRNWHKDNTPKTAGAEESVRFIAHGLSLLRATGKPFVVENPTGKLRVLPVMDGLHRANSGDTPKSPSVTYCQYGHTNRKPTDIWRYGFNWTPRKPCKNGAPCHTAAPRGSTTGTQGKSKSEDTSIVPLELWLEILDAVSISRTAGESR